MTTRAAKPGFSTSERSLPSDVESLTRDQLLGVARLWRRSQRQFVTSFLGASMLPSIRPGERVRVRCTDDVVPGDVVVFASGDSVIVHRLVARTASWTLFRGDANTPCDPCVISEEDLIGRVEAVERDGAFQPVAGYEPRLQQRMATSLAIGLLRANVRLGSAVLLLLSRSRRLLISAWLAVRGVRPSS